jgi:cytidyltransferase-like protein
VVLANGCFDPLHYGHLLHLEAAKKLGDTLIVSVTRDPYVNKGEGRPVFNDVQRAHMLRALRCVDGVFVCASALEALLTCGPDIFVKGKEYKEQIEKADLEYCKKAGIRIEFTDTPKWSSTALLHYYAS